MAFPICRLGDEVKLPFSNLAKLEDYGIHLKLFRVFHLLSKILIFQIYQILAFHAVILNFIQSIYSFIQLSKLFFIV